MDDADREFALLAASVERTARVQLDEVTRFLETAPRRRLRARGNQAPEDEEVADPMVRRGSVLARHLSAAYEALLSHVAARRGDYETLPDAEARRGAITEMRQLVAGARNLHRSLGWLDAARVPPLDLGTRYLVDNVAAELVAADAEVTVVAGERSYGKVANPLSSVFALSGADPPAEQLAIVVFIPRREQRSGLLHPLIVHELGHAAEDQHGLVLDVLEAATTDPDFMSQMAAAAESHAKAVGDDEAATIQSFGSRLADWLEEAVCDAFATQILGPTYLYSFMAIVGTSDLDRAGEEHPPTRQRIRLLLTQLGALGWDDLMTETAPDIDVWFRATAAQTHSYSDIEDNFCVTALERLAADVRAAVAEHVGELSFRADDFSAVGSEIAQLLDAGVPPSQTLDRRRIGRAAIILGSWLFAVRRQGSDLAALASAPGLPELSRLLPKALQDAALLKAWVEDA